MTSRPSAKTGHPLTQAHTQLQFHKFTMLRAQEWQKGQRDVDSANALCVLAVLWAEPMVTECVLDDSIVKTAVNGGRGSLVVVCIGEGDFSWSSAALWQEGQIVRGSNGCAL